MEIHERFAAGFRRHVAPIEEPSVETGVLFVEDQVLHTGVGEFLSGLTEKHHQHDPFYLLDIDIGRLQGQQPVDQDFPLRRRQDADLLEVGDEAATAGVETVCLEVVEYPGAVRGLRAANEAIVVVGQTVEPIQGAVDFRVSKAGPGEFVSELVMIRFRLFLSVDVSFEQLHQDVEHVFFHSWSVSLRNVTTSYWCSLE